MAIWLVPKVETSEIAGLTVKEGELVYNTDTDKLLVGVSDGTDVTLEVVGPGDATYTEDSILTTDENGAVEEVSLNTNEVLTRTSSGFSSSKVTNDLIEDDSINLAKLVKSTVGHSVLVTDNDGTLKYINVAQGQIVARDVNGDITPQKLKASMINEGEIPHSKLEDVKAGQVLGALPSTSTTNLDVRVEAINIADFAGSKVTSSDEPPLSPAENDLWYYAGAQTGDNARLYIYQQGMWLDASPGIVNTNPGADGETGPAGADGTDGQSVTSVVLQERTSSEDITIEFYSGTTIISTISIPIGDIATTTGLPNANGLATGETYILNIPETGEPSWVPQQAVGSITLGRDDGSYTLTSGDISAGVNKTISMADFGLTGIPLSAAHVLVYSGFVLTLQLDYTFDTMANTIIINASTLEFLAANTSIDIINYRATLS